MGRNVYGEKSIVEKAITTARNKLSFKVQKHFDNIVDSLEKYLNNLGNDKIRFDAPDSKNWFSVKYKPTKAILSFRAKRGALAFDIDTEKIADERKLLDFQPQGYKLNKVYKAKIYSTTDEEDVEYFIAKMKEAIDVFDRKSIS